MQTFVHLTSGDAGGVKATLADLGRDERWLDDSDIWARVRGSDVDVMLWHGPHPAERIFALRACWHLRDRPERLHEVALHATGAKWRGGIARTRVSDVAARAKRWEELRSKSGDWIRALDGDDIIELPLTAFDDAILAEARTWTESKKVLGMILASNAIGFALLTWRIRELVRDGSLESRGGANDFGLPAELRRSKQ